MNLLLKMFKPWIHKALAAFEKEEEDKSINFLNTQLMRACDRLKLSISGEQLDALTKTAYESVGTIIINKVDSL